MKTRISWACIVVIALSVGLTGCAIKLSGSARLSSDGLSVILDGQNPLQVDAAQPELPPPPPKKAKIVEEKIEISEKVQFEYNKAEILEVSHDLLNDVATVMKQHPEVKKIRIEGHASSEGDDDYNMKLSEKRAKAVMDYLISAGVDPARMESAGYGEERPIASNDTEEGREKNRRVEFNIIARFSKEELEAAKKQAEAAKADEDETDATAEEEAAGESDEGDAVGDEEKGE